MICRVVTSTHLTELIVLLVLLTSACSGGSGGGTTPPTGNMVDSVEPEPQPGFTDVTADSGLSYEVGFVYDRESAITEADSSVRDIVTSGAAAETMTTMATLIFSSYVGTSVPIYSSVTTATLSLPTWQRLPALHY